MKNMLLNTVKKVQEELDLSSASPLRRFILESDYGYIGSYVIRNSELTKHFTNTAVSICRRRFKVADIILMSILDEDEEGEAGIAFTENGIFYWQEDETFVADIPYGTIRTVDYDEESVIVTTTDGKSTELFCGEDEDDEKYSRYMYNFIMDVKEKFDELKAVGNEGK